MSTPPPSAPVSYNSHLPGCSDRLLHVDFWPHCINPWVTDLNDVHFYRFDTLLPRVNSWLREHLALDLVKCETVEKKLTSLELLSEQSPTYEQPERSESGQSESGQSIQTLYLKGLRVWYKHRYEPRRHALQIGYRNCLPQCLNMGFIYPKYEDLGSMYARLNSDVLERPLEGDVVTAEMVSIHLDSSVWEGPEVEVDKCHWYMSDKQHLYLFARIFYLFQCPSYEQLGAADFVPDIIAGSSEGSPQYTDLTTVNKKMNSWLKQVKDIRICNIQTLPSLVDSSSAKVNASMNFLPNCHSCSLIHFVRVTYVRPKYGLPPGGLHIPSAISMKTFLPVNTTNGLENHIELWGRMLMWLQHIDNELLCLETFYRPGSLCQTGDSHTLLTPSEWTVHRTSSDTGTIVKTREPTPQAHCIRLYLCGIFEEPLLEVDEEAETLLEHSSEEFQEESAEVEDT